jgi:hypothetical protein
MSDFMTLAEFCRMRDENAVREIERRGIEYRAKADGLWAQIEQLQEAERAAGNVFEKKQIDEEIKALAWEWQRYDAPLSFMRAHWQAATERLKADDYDTPSSFRGYRLDEADGADNGDAVLSRQMGLFEGVQ